MSRPAHLCTPGVHPHPDAQPPVRPFGTCVLACRKAGCLFPCPSSHRRMRSEREIPGKFPLMREPFPGNSAGNLRGGGWPGFRSGQFPKTDAPALSRAPKTPALCRGCPAARRPRQPVPTPGAAAAGPPKIHAGGLTVRKTGAPANTPPASGPVCRLFRIQHPYACDTTLCGVSAGGATHAKAEKP